MQRAVDVFGTDYETPLHEVDVDAVSGGTWEVPQFVLRQPLAYTDFARIIWTLRQSETVSVLAAALGFRERDVVLAEEVWARHRRHNMKTCGKCGKPYLNTCGECGG